MQRTLTAIPALFLAAPALAQLTVFEPAPNALTATVWDLSADGRAVAGTSGGHGFYWSIGSGRVEFGTEPGMLASNSATGLSADGNVAVGTAFNNFTDNHRLYRWTTTSGYQDLGSMGSWQQLDVGGVSGNGSVIVGRGQNGGGATAPTATTFRWTPAGGFQSLGYLRPGSTYSEARGVSRDGNVVVGVSMPSALSGLQEAYRWTPELGMQPLRQESGSPFTDTRASNISGNGQVVVGSGFDPLTGRSRPFRWTPSTGMADLGIAEGALSGVGTLATFDGAIIVTSMNYGGGLTIPYLWTESGGYVRWSDYIAQFGVTLPATYTSFSIEGISDDGRVFAGWTRAGSIGGSSRGFVVSIPTPAAACLLSLGLFALNRRRR